MSPILPSERSCRFPGRQSGHELFVHELFPQGNLRFPLTFAGCPRNFPRGSGSSSYVKRRAVTLCCISSVMPKEPSEKSSDKLTQLDGSLRSYRGPWKGQLVLVCRKCQKKIKHSGTKNKLAKLSKT